MNIGSKILKSIHTWFNPNCSSTVGVWHWVDYTPATQVRRRLRASGQRELIEAYLKWNIDNLSDSSCSTIILGSEGIILANLMLNRIVIVENTRGYQNIVPGYSLNDDNTVVHKICKYKYFHPWYILWAYSNSHQINENNNTND